MKDLPLTFLRASPTISCSRRDVAVRDGSRPALSTVQSHRESGRARRRPELEIPDPPIEADFVLGDEFIAEITAENGEESATLARLEREAAFATFAGPWLAKWSWKTSKKTRDWNRESARRVMRPSVDMG